MKDEMQNASDRLLALVVNLATANGFGITITKSFLLRVDEDRIKLLLAAVRESGCGTNPTCRGGLTMSVDRGRPEGAGPRSK